jgi:hypothetical protein
MKKPLSCLFFIIILTSYTTLFADSRQNVYHDCMMGKIGSYYIYDKQCKWKMLDCNEYADWVINHNTPTWSPSPGYTCPNGSVINLTIPTMIIPNNMNNGSNIDVDQYKNQNDSYQSLHDDISKTKLYDKVSINKTKMKGDLDNVLIDYFHWVKTEAPIDQQSIGVEVDTNYDYYYNCISEVLAYNFTKEQNGNKPFLDEFDYFFYIKNNLSETIDICHDLKEN